MNIVTPSYKELSDYFFNKCGSADAEKIELWFKYKGNTQEAEDLLHELWTNVECVQAGVSAGETRLAFDTFCRNLKNASKERRRRTGRVILRWIGRVAAVLFIPLVSFTVWQSIRSSQENGAEWLTKSVAYGTTADIVLPDGTLVNMNSGSTIVYPEKFSSKKRQVFFSGEAYFDVVKNSRSPFEIKTEKSSVSVLGTEFNLKVYPEDRSIELALVEGKVEFSSEDNGKVLLTAGEMLEYDKNTGIVSTSKFSPDAYSSWKDGTIYFKNRTLSYIAKQLERIYNVDIVIRTEALKDMTYYMAFVNDETLDEIIAVLNKDNRIKVARNGNLIEIY